MTLRYDPTTGRAKLTIYAGRDVNGRQRQRTRTWHSASLRAAKREAAAIEAELRADLEARRQRLGTVNGLVDEWLRFRDAQDSPNTVRGRKRIIARIRTGLGKVALAELSARHVDQWMTELRAQGLRPTTIANHHTALRAILNQGDAWDMVTATPTRKAKPPGRQRRKPAPPSAAAVRVLIDSAPPDLRLCAELAAQVGMRESEIVGLQWGDIEFERINGAGVIHVNRALVRVNEVAPRRWEAVTKLPKSNQARSVPVSRAVLELLAGQRRRQEQIARDHGVEPLAGGWVIADLVKHPAGIVPRKPMWLAHAWIKHRNKHGSTSTFHDLRHWHATELLDAGVSLAVVQKRLGHLQLTTTANVYTHTVAASEAAAAELISQRRLALPAGKEQP